MFGILGGSASIFAGRRDPTKEKAAPPLPTPVCFPAVRTVELCGSSDRPPAFAQVEKQVARIRRPPDLSIEILHPINLEPATWVQSEHLVPVPDQQNDSKLHNGRAAPTQHDFDSRSKEVAILNETGYAILAGKMRGDKSAPRLMQFRRFWEGLDSMANYWDTSLDEYIPVIEGRYAKRDSPVSPRSTPPPSPSKRQRMSLADEERPIHIEQAENCDERELSGTYRGYRTSNGANMPEQHRLDTVRGFLEPILWPFGFSIQPPRSSTLLVIGNVRVPVRLSYSVWRLPKEREKAQGRWVEGPVMGVDCRLGTGFQLDSVSSNVDLVGEVTALLVLAQERAREGRSEIKPGEDKWWTTKPRWGGGEGGEAGDGRPDGEQRVGEEGAEHKPSNTSGDAVPAAKRLHSRQKPTMHEVWEALKPSAGYWDPKADYQRIGRDQHTETDQVYLVSSLNHHISLLKMEVHESYLQALTAGSLLSDPPSGSSWCKPRLLRSKWYDLFSPDERLEAMGLIWRLAAYLARSEVIDNTWMT